MKGDIARAMFYMAVRYEGDEINTENLELSDTPNVKNAEFGKLSSLLEWHVRDPVDDKELKRNDIIEEIQGNRNPFVDDPTLVLKLYSSVN